MSIQQKRAARAVWFMAATPDKTNSGMVLCGHRHRTPEAAESCSCRYPASFPVMVVRAGIRSAMKRFSGDAGITISRESFASRYGSVIAAWGRTRDGKRTYGDGDVRWSYAIRDAFEAFGIQRKEPEQTPKAETPKAETPKAETAKAETAEAETAETDDGSPIHHVMEDTLRRLIKLRENVWIAGPAGSGKTTSVVSVAESLGYKVFVQQPAFTPYDILGAPRVDGGLIETSVVRWATCSEPALLLIDEIDRCQPSALLAINSALANSFATFPAIGTVNIPSSHVVVATANTWGGGGATAYVGSMKQDAALLNRFTARIDWQYDPRVERRMAGTAVRFLPEALAIRSNLEKAGIKLIWSPRDTRAYARRRESGLSMKEAVGLSALASLDSAQRAAALAGVNAA